MFEYGISSFETKILWWTRGDDDYDVHIFIRQQNDNFIEVEGGIFERGIVEMTPFNVLIFANECCNIETKGQVFNIMSEEKVEEFVTLIENHDPKVSVIEEIW